MSASAILSSLLSSAQLASRASSVVHTPSTQASGEFEQMVDKYETPASNVSSAVMPGSTALQSAIAALQNTSSGANTEIVAKPLASAAPQGVAAAAPEPAATAVSRTSQSDQPTESATPASLLAVTPKPPAASITVVATPVAKAVAKSGASHQTPEAAAPGANATLDIGAAFAAVAPLVAPTPAAAAPDISAAAQTIASALAAPTQSAATAAQAPAPGAAPRARLSAVQTRTHLTVQDSRLFQTTSARTQDALDASSAANPSADATAKPAATVPTTPPVETPAADDADAAPVSKSDALITPLTLASGFAAADTAQSNTSSLPVAELPDRIASETASLAAQPARGPVKELQFQLDPADLGTVYIKLRMTTGRLSVDIGVSNASALDELENQREAMTSKLEGTAQPLDSLVIHQQAEPQNGASSPTGYFSGSHPSGGEAASRKFTREGGERPSRPTQAAAPNAASASQCGALVV